MKENYRKSQFQKYNVNNTSVVMYMPKSNHRDEGVKQGELLPTQMLGVTVMLEVYTHAHKLPMSSFT